MSETLSYGLPKCDHYSNFTLHKDTALESKRKGTVD